MGSEFSTSLSAGGKQKPFGPDSSAQNMATGKNNDVATQSGNLARNQNNFRWVENFTGLVEKKDDLKAESSSRLVLKEKEKKKKKIQQHLRQKIQKTEKDAPKPGPKNHSDPPTRRENPTPIYHIKWDGLMEESREELREKCCLCENDLADEPLDTEYYEEFASFPEVAVLPCGHAFHQNCLQLITSEEKSRDPPCFLCQNDF